MKLPASAVFGLAFRPMFLLGSLLAVLAVALWIAALSGYPLGSQPNGGWLLWHQHELIFGFTMAIIGGFLLTAVQSWTGRPGLTGMPLAGLVMLWLLARLVWFQPLSPLALPLLLGVHLAFPLAVTFVMARMLWAVRQQRNYPVVLILLLLAGAQAALLFAAAAEDFQRVRQAAFAALWLIAALMGLIGGRVIPFFTQRGLSQKRGVTPWPWLDWSLLSGSLFAAGLFATGLGLQPNAWSGWLFTLLAVGHALRLARWFSPALLRAPLLWSLHLAYAWLALACAGIAAWQWGWIANLSTPLHALTVGSIGGLIIAMLARVSLGHTGRELKLPRGFIIALLLINLAALVRVFAVGYGYLLSLWLATFCWCAAFGMYLVVYGPMLLTRRVDGKPG